METIRLLGATDTTLKNIHVGKCIKWIREYNHSIAKHDSVVFYEVCLSYVGCSTAALEAA